jgi:tetratricopeptide (TPR) repeat protein
MSSVDERIARWRSGTDNLAPPPGFAERVLTRLEPGARDAWTSPAWWRSGWREARRRWVLAGAFALATLLAVGWAALGAHKAWADCRAPFADDASEPDWSAALAACQAVLAREPKNPEAQRLIAQVREEMAARDHFLKGVWLAVQLHNDDARREFAQVPAGSRYAAKATEEMRALPAPVPADALARPGPPSPPTPQAPVVSQGAPTHDVLADVPSDEALSRALADRDPERALHLAVWAYWEGKSNESVRWLQRLLGETTLTAVHPRARQLRKQVFEVAGLFSDGEALLQKDNLDQAAAAFTEMLRLDEEVLRSIQPPGPSFFRRNAAMDIAANAYEHGKSFMDHLEEERACRAWKLGFGFFKGNTDLNRACAVCSLHASRALDAAQGCEDLERALALSVDGDGLKDRIAAREAQLHCGREVQP